LTNPYSKYLSICCGLLCISFTTTAQEIENLFYRVEGSNVIITYDLKGEPGQLFRIEVFSSHNNYSTKLIQISGDAGEHITTGTAKSVTWDAAAELGNYDGSIELEVRGYIMPPFLEFTNITGSFKRGKTNTILWNSTGGELNIRLELHQAGQKISELGNIPNNGSYSWFIPKDRKPGKDFKLVAISSQKQASSISFKISPKIPIVLKVLPLLVVGGVVAVIVSGWGGDGPERLSDPIKPGG